MKLDARLGEMAIRRIERGGVPGIEVLAQDRGKGIVDPTVALAGGDARAEPGAGLGIGLGGVYRLADEVDFDVRQGEGTFIAARKFSEPVRRQEVAVLARPRPGEEEGGDEALFAWQGDDLFLAVADGLGHGPAARELEGERGQSALQQRLRQRLIGGQMQKRKQHVIGP